MRLFDVYMAVDWSARSAPSPARPTHDALWVAEALVDEKDAPDSMGETYWRTRQACLAHIRTRLRHHVNHGRRILLGFDFCYGYPAGYAAALGLTGNAPPWRRIWNEITRLIRDGANNGNNRFAVAAALNERCAGQVAWSTLGICCRCRLICPTREKSRLPLYRQTRPHPGTTAPD